jgi:hypothetical protein
MNHPEMKSPALVVSNVVPSQVGHLAWCHYAADEEQGIYSFCPNCGSIWLGYDPTKLPSEIQAHPTYYQQAGRIIPLACRGPVVGL